MTTQLELAPPAPAPALARDAAWLEQLLHGHGRWLTAADIFELSGKMVDDRRVRKLASASGWIISGDSGYKHLEHATPEQIEHATSRLESQAKQMAERAGLIRRNAHRRIG